MAIFSLIYPCRAESFAAQNIVGFGLDMQNTKKGYPLDGQP